MGPSGARVAGLDVLRVVLVAGVIVAHAAMSYGATGTWVYEEDSLTSAGSTVLGVLVGLGALFGMGLFFLMSGWLSGASLQRKGRRAHLVDRLRRLGPPFVLYVLVVWPALGWLVDRAEGDDVAFVDAYRHRFEAGGWRSLGSGPLWFVAVLLLVELAWLGRCALRPPRAPGGSAPATVPARLLVVSATAIAVGTFVVRLGFGLDTPQIFDLHVWLWPQAFVLFSLGAHLAADGTPPALSRRARRASVGAIAAAAAVLVVAIFASDGPDPFTGGLHWPAAVMAGVEGVYSVGVSVLLLDLAWRRAAHPHEWIHRAAIGSYVAFVAQGPVLVLAALAIRRWGAPGEVKFALVAAWSVALCFAIGLLAHGRRLMRSASAPVRPAR